MKKTIAFICILTIAIFSVFAYQETYRLSSDEVQTFLTLRKASGTMTPDPTYPISGTQLLNLVQTIDVTKLSGVYKDMYYELVASLEAPEVYVGKGDIGFDFDFSLLAGEVIRANKEDREVYDILPYKDRTPLIDLKAKAYMSKYFTGLIDFDIRRAYDEYDKTLTLTSLASIGKISVGFPSQAYGSVGFDRFNVTVGRDRIGSGNGKTGNLQFGENSLFSDYFKFSFVGNNLSYDFTIDSIDSRDNASIDINGATKNLYVHRLSYAFGNVINVTLYEGMVVNSGYGPDKEKTSGSITNNLSVLNPFMIYHDVGSFYNASSNNYAGVEILANLPARFQIDAQFFIDQIMKKSEDPLENGEGAFAALLNVSTTQPFVNGTIDVYGEVVYGNPYVYLKNSHGYGLSHTRNAYKFGGEYQPQLHDYVADQCLQYNNGDSVDSQYIGYKYGGDLFSIGFGAAYKQKNLNVDASLQFIAKGDYGIRTNEQRAAQGRADYDSFGKVFGYAAKGNHEVQKTIKLYTGCDFTVLEGLDISADLCGLFNINYWHTIEKKPSFQFALGVKINPLEFFNINKSIL